jgi:hypothetical protein
MTAPSASEFAWIRRVIYWIIIAVVAILGYIVGQTTTKRIMMTTTTSLGDCITPDTIKTPNLTQHECVNACPKCFWQPYGPK